MIVADVDILAGCIRQGRLNEADALSVLFWPHFRIRR